MIRISGDRVEVSGPMTLRGATALLAEGEAAIASDASVFDLAAVTEMDSSCLAVVFAWMRAAKAAGKSLCLLNPPQSLLSLAAVYDVADLLPQH
ncbi:STAS domain-containing protein [Sulfuritalea sp.]|uniref:STAS domain-containing protein n=1 Tax=Sulfuritalea sp. TaxID=2480090 RepID=UPI00286E0B4C|nr:STAS domain-containing protein [Sulfuritalea sp.]